MASTRTTKGSPAQRQKRVGVLFTCVGRRVELLRAFRRAAEHLPIRLEIHGADMSRLSPAVHHVDKAHTVPAVSDRRYISDLVGLVRRHKLHLLIPLLDPELPALSAATERFAEVGCRALVSLPSVIRTCRDKILTFKALKGAGIDTPQTWTWREMLKRKRHRFPYFLKPRKGSAAMGNFVINNRDELATFGRRVRDPIVQEYVEGVEHTLDVYTGFDGKPRCVVPRRRLEVRTGEVSKGLIVKNPAIMAIGCAVAEALGGCRGVVTVQCIVTRQGRIRVIEINPRFGGGVPLSIQAGADFPRWILSELIGRQPRISATAFRDDLAMLRFDESVFVRNASRFLAEPARPKRAR